MTRRTSQDCLTQHQKAGWRPIGATYIPALWDGGNGTRCTAVAWMQGLSPVELALVRGSKEGEMG